MARLPPLWLVDDLQHADVAVVVVCVDNVDHPLEKLVGPFVLVVDIKAGGGGSLGKRNI